MIPATPDLQTAGLIVFAIAAVAAIGLAAAVHRENGPGVFKELETETGWAYEMYPEKVQKGLPGLKQLKAWNADRKKRKAHGGGYVTWYLIKDNAWPKPRYVKPERKDGGNVRELKIGGETYLFPEKAKRVNEKDGSAVYVHVEGESEPLEFGQHDAARLDAKALTDLIEMKVTSTNPAGILAGMDTKQIMTYAVIGLVGYFVAAHFGVI